MRDLAPLLEVEGNRYRVEPCCSRDGGNQFHAVRLSPAQHHITVRGGMTEMELLNEAQELREMATRVRRLAKGLLPGAAQERMLGHAMELEADAKSLERHTAEVK